MKLFFSHVRVMFITSLLEPQPARSTRSKSFNDLRTQQERSYSCRVLKGGCSRGGGNWGTIRIPREDWGTLGNIRKDYGNHHPLVNIDIKDVVHRTLVRFNANNPK